MLHAVTVSGCAGYAVRSLQQSVTCQCCCKRSDATTLTSNGNNCANSSSINIKSFGQRSTCICCQSLSSRIQFLADLNDIRSLGAHHHQSQDAAPASLITLCNSATACRIRAVAVQAVEGWSVQPFAHNSRVVSVRCICSICYHVHVTCICWVH